MCALPHVLYRCATVRSFASLPASLCRLDSLDLAATLTPLFALARARARLAARLATA